MTGIPAGYAEGRLRYGLKVARDDDFRVVLAGTELVIERADPRILISAELLETIRANPTPYAFVATLPSGEVLKLCAANRTVIYRIGERIEVDGTARYLAEWPD